MERKLLSFIAATGIVALFASHSMAQYGPGYGSQQGTLPNYLFSQYTTPAGASTATAGMYPAPHYVPGHVGNSWYTYQPLQPHELMWQHKRVYYNYYAGADAFYADPCNNRGGGGLNKTTVVWQAGANHLAPLPGSIVPLSKLHYALANHWYCLNGNCGPRGIAGGHVAGAASRLRGAAGGLLHHHGGTAADCGSACPTGQCASTQGTSVVATGQAGQLPGGQQSSRR